MHQPKKILIAVFATLAGTGLSGSASAQSNVTIYGVMDTFVTNIHADGTPSVLRMDSSGSLASRLGFKGTEDLGGKYSANFALEAGLNANDGTGADANRLFNRQAWVGLGTPYGELRLGRQNTPQFYMNGRFDAFNGGTQASGWNNIFGVAPRIDNAIGYFSPVVNNVKIQALVSRGASGGAPVAAEIAANQSEYFAAEYENGPLYVGLNYQYAKSAGTASATRTGLGASYVLNPSWTIYAAMDHETKSDDSLKSNLYSLSALYKFTPVSSLAFGWAGLKDKVSGAGHGDATQWSALYRYSLSKRTTLYTALSRLDQKGQRNNLSLNGAAVVEPGSQVKAGIPGGGIDGVQLGILHTF